MWTIIAIFIGFALGFFAACLCRSGTSPEPKFFGGD